MPPDARSPEEKEEDRINNIIKKAKSIYSNVEWVTPGLGYEVLYKGAYAHDMLYSAIFEWLKQNGYNAVVGGDDKYEVLYEDRFVNGFRELWHMWRMQKDAGQHADYFMFVNMHLLGLNKKEIMHEGKKIKIHDVEVDVWIRGGIRWKNPFEDKGQVPKFVEFLFGPKANKAMENNLDDIRGKVWFELYEDVIDLLNLVKANLGLPTTGHPKDFLINPKGLPQLSTQAPNTDPYNL